LPTLWFLHKKAQRRHDRGAAPTQRAEEMQPLLGKARAAKRQVVIEVFHSRDGQPLLIHPRLQPRTSVNLNGLDSRPQNPE